jgi:hypothetical protein
MDHIIGVVFFFAAGEGMDCRPLLSMLAELSNNLAA